MPAQSKYASLGQYLRERRDQASIPLTFADIEQITGHRLPASKRYPAWWSNNPSNNTMTKIWLDAGFETEQVDISGEKLVFRNAEKGRAEIMGVDGASALFDSIAKELADEPRAFQHAAGKSLHPLIGALKGTFTIDPSWDLTKPALDPEELAEWEVSLDRKADMIEQGVKENRRK